MYYWIYSVFTRITHEGRYVELLPNTDKTYKVDPAENHYSSIFVGAYRIGHS